MITEIIAYAIWINIALAIFNLIPIPPLDGSHVLEALLPYEQAEALRNMGQMGFIILIVVIMFPPTQELLYSIISAVFRIFV